MNHEIDATDIEVEVSVVRHARTPNGLGVLLQLPTGYVVMRPEDARELAATLTETAEEAEGSITWRKPSPEFGAAMPNGSCTVVVNYTVCGFPRRLDGTCTNGHPAQPEEER